MCIENTRCTLHDEPMQIVGANRFAKSFSEPVEEVEDKGFFDLNFFVRAFQRANTPPLGVGGENPSGHGRQKQSEEKNRPRHAGASLLRRRLVMKVLF